MITQAERGLLAPVRFQSEHASTMIRGLLLHSVTLAQEGRPTEARAALDDAVRAAPNVAPVRVAAATVRFVLHDYQDAMAELEQAIAIATATGADTAAPRMAIDLARRLGWYHESLAAIDRALPRARAAPRCT